jgi:hypothetical protein
MKKYTNKEIIEEVNKLENIIDKKNYLKDLLNSTRTLTTLG